MNTIDLSSARWRKSTYSSSNANCVEVAFTDPAIAVRDTKDRQGPVLVFSPEGWRDFTADVRNGEFDLG